MTNFLMYNSVTCETGRALASALGIESGEHLPERRFDKVIRFGNREKVGYAPTKTLNKREALDKSANKAIAFKIFQENNVPCPPIVTRFEGELLVGRRPSHQHGSGMYFITSQRDFDRAKQIGCNHFMKYIPCKREFRCHIFGGELIFAYERVLPSDPISLSVRNDWNEVRIDNPPQNTVDASIKAVEVCGLDFGAVDIILSESDRSYVLEINSGPGLVDGERKKPSFEFYRRKMKEWLNMW